LIFDVLILGKSCINMGFITVNRRAFPIGLNINSYNYPLYKPSNKEKEALENAGLIERTWFDKSGKINKRGSIEKAIIVSGKPCPKCNGRGFFGYSPRYKTGVCSFCAGIGRTTKV